MITQTLLPWVMAGFCLALLLNVWRLLLGPHVADRVLALDTLYINALSLLVLVGLWQFHSFYFEVALLIGLLGFVGTVALAKYIARGDIVK